jgi:lipopolysaccharide/colanic/teichoic acid biosynthesis glycosyltransferase
MSSTFFKRVQQQGEADASALPDVLFLAEAQFLRMLYLERKRTERSGRRFVLMLLKSDNLLRAANKQVFETLLHTLFHSSRETDIKGWYKDGLILGVIFTDLGCAEGKVVAHALLTKIIAALDSTLSNEQINQITLSFHVFPDDWSEYEPEGLAASALYPEVLRAAASHRVSHLLKRAIDVLGSASGLILLSPLLAIIAALVKLTSEGPVLFRQTRIGRCGKTFTFLKFRSMYLNSDATLHQQYVKTLISSANGSGQATHSHPASFKLTTDPRVTPLGRFLRRTSLDELPQLVNVLTGEMSLVGPRPPILYEFECYQTWHKMRLLAVKPGITGLWQVAGRSRVPFDQMVRMDLTYARSWSLWMDVKILLRTPVAVFSCRGAY